MTDHRQYAPATVRNRDFILDVLRDVLPTTGAILEVASGSGEHVVHFARNLPSLVFQPFDPEPDALVSVAAWVKAAHATKVRAPIVLDARRETIPTVANFLHPLGRSTTGRTASSTRLENALPEAKLFGGEYEEPAAHVHAL
jgi:hypothetical protein